MGDNESKIIARVEEYEIGSSCNIKRDYHNKQFANPYYERKKGRFGFNLVIYLEAIFVIFLVYLVFYSDLFKIKTIELRGNDMIKKEDFISHVDNNISYWRFFLVPNKNLLAFDANRLRERIKEKYNLNKLDINRHWQELDIAIEEKISYLIINNASSTKSYLSDTDGIVTQELTGEEYQKYTDRFPHFLIKQNEINLGDKLLTARNVNFVIDLDKIAKDEGLNPANYQVGGANEINLTTKQGWQAYFDINNDAITAVKNLKLVLQQKIGEQKFQYIDMRLLNKVFYK
ncbi:MAG: hypothetical protein WCL61_02530 [bacterium]